jgi:excisionase family DNA binding protein
MTLKEDARSDRLALTVAEAAEELTVSRITVYRLVEAGELRARRCGSRILIPRRALEQYLEGEAT